MKKSHRILPIIMALTMVLALRITVLAADEAEAWTSADFTYEQYEKTVYGCDYSRTINMEGIVISGLSESGLSKIENNKDLVLPRKDDEGNTIIGVGDSAFTGLGLTSVRFPTGMMVPYDDTLTNTVTKRGNFIIASNAFAKNNLTTLNLPAGVIAVLPGAFQYNKLTSVQFPATIWWIETTAFARNEISRVVFPKTTNFALEMHGMAFAKNNIESVTLPDTTEVVNKDVFDGNPGMEPVSEDAPDGQKEIGGGVVYMYTSNANLLNKDRIHTVDRTVASQKSWHQKLVVTEEAAGSDDAWVQADFTYELSDDSATITGLSESGAAKRGVIRDLVIPDYIISGQKKYPVTHLSPAPSAKNGLFAASADDFDTVDLPYNLKVIGNYAFQNCGLDAVYFPPKLEEIGMAAFQTNDLKSIDLPDTVTMLGSGAFATNPLLEKISLSRGMTEVPTSAFGCSDAKHYMTKLTEIELHEGITKIGTRAFAGNNFHEIKIPSTCTEIGAYAFSTKNYLNEPCTVELPEGLRTIGDNAFRNKVIESIMIPSSVQGIPANTFRKEYSNGAEGIVTKVYLTRELQYTDKVNFPDSEFHKLYLTNPQVWTVDDFEFGAVGELYGITGLSESGEVKLQTNHNLILPDTDGNGQAVAAIGEGAFRNCGISGVVIPAGVVSVGIGAFGKNAIKSLEIPATVESIGAEAFKENEIATVVFAGDAPACTEIGSKAFANNSMRAVQLPEGLVKLAGDAWADNNGVVKLYIDGSIGSELQADPSCQEVLTGTIPDADAPWCIDDFVIDGTIITGLSEAGEAKLLVNHDLVLPDKNADGGYITTIASASSGLFKVQVGDEIYEPEHVVLPAKLEGIGNGAFGRSATLKYATEPIGDVEFPATLCGIGNQAFQNNGMSRVILPDSVTSIGTAAFMNAGDKGPIRTVRLSPGMYEVPASAFGGHGITELEIPEGVVSIGTRAFQANPLTKLTLPSTLESIGNYAFENHQLESLVIPDGVKTIGQYAFKVYAEARQKTLTKLELSRSLESIGKQAFYGSNLAEVEIPVTLTVLPADVFDASIQMVTLKTADPDFEATTKFVTEGAMHRVVYDKLSCTGWNAGSFTYDGDAITGLSEAGRAEWAENKNLVLPDVTPSGVAIKSIADGAFAIPPEDVVQQKYDVLSPKGLESVALPAELESIGDKAFEYNNLSSIELRSGLTSIGESAFHGNKLRAASIPDSVTSLGAGAFAMNDIRELRLSRNVTVIPQGAFSMNIWMTEVDIPDTVTEIGDTAFAGARLETLEIPSSVTRIGRKAFHLHRLTSLTIPGSVRVIDESAFEGTYKFASLRELTLCEGIESIGRYAFKEGLLTEVHLPDSLKEFGEEPFLNNEGKDQSNVVELHTMNKAHLDWVGSSFKVVYDGEEDPGVDPGDPDGPGENPDGPGTDPDNPDNPDGPGETEAEVMERINAVAFKPSVKKTYNSVAITLDALPSEDMFYLINGEKITGSYKKFSVKTGSSTKYRIAVGAEFEGRTISGDAVTVSATCKLGKVTRLTASGKSKRMTLKWVSVPGAKYYQIYYKRAGAKAKYVTTTARGKTIKKLKKGKYTVKVRAVTKYRTVSGKASYGTWSAKRTVRVR